MSTQVLNFKFYLFAFVLSISAITVSCNTQSSNREPEKCGGCNGKGSALYTCYICSGSGIENGHICSKCKGNKMVYDKVCKVCGGDGIQYN